MTFQKFNRSLILKITSDAQIMILLEALVLTQRFLILGGIPQYSQYLVLVNFHHYAMTGFQQINLFRFINQLHGQKFLYRFQKPLRIFRAFLFHFLTFCVCVNE